MILVWPNLTHTVQWIWHAKMMLVSNSWMPQQIGTKLGACHHNHDSMVLAHLWHCTTYCSREREIWVFAYNGWMVWPNIMHYSKSLITGHWQHGGCIGSCTSCFAVFCYSMHQAAVCLRRSPTGRGPGLQTDSCTWRGELFNKSTTLGEFEVSIK